MLAETKNVKLEFIPADLTAFIQPADVAWLKSFKAAFSQRWCDWFMNSHHSWKYASTNISNSHSVESRVLERYGSVYDQ